MQRPEKCCSHCPGNWKSSARKAGDHACALPTYVSGNLKLSSLKKSNPAEQASSRSKLLRAKIATSGPHNERPASCYERFAVARKFHAENLQHQPLPDRVDDSIFENVRGALNVKNTNRDMEKRFGSASTSNVQQNATRRSRLSQKNHPELRYGPELGCKIPTTNMDLAICWEAPLDPIYEPSPAIHIDGTDGGPAPAIFALVNQEIPRQEENFHSAKCDKKPLLCYEAKFSNVRNRCRCNDNEKFDRKISRISRLSDEFTPDSRVKVHDDESGDECYGQLKFSRKSDVNETKHSVSLENDLCDNLESFHISDEHRNDRSGSSRGAAVARPEKLQPLHSRHCNSCECRGERAARKPRQRSSQSAHVGMRNIRRNGLPTRINGVPRPKTPYAKRSFCIDTLSPPFGIVSGCRDADYPEHWRLTSVYQQSYRNPLKRQGMIFNCN